MGPAAALGTCWAASTISADRPNLRRCATTTLGRSPDLSLRAAAPADGNGSLAPALMVIRGRWPDLPSPPGNRPAVRGPESCSYFYGHAGTPTVARRDGGRCRHHYCRSAWPAISFLDWLWLTADADPVYRKAAATSAGFKSHCVQGATAVRCASSRDSHLDLLATACSPTCQ